MGGDYFCESRVKSGYPSGFNPDDPLISGMVKAAVGAVAVAHSTILHTSLSISQAPPDPIGARLCHLDGGKNSPVEFTQLHVKYCVH